MLINNGLATGRNVRAIEQWLLKMKKYVCKYWSGSSFRLALKLRSNHSCFDVSNGLFHNVYDTRREKSYCSFLIKKKFH